MHRVLWVKTESRDLMGSKTTWSFCTVLAQCRNILASLRAQYVYGCKSIAELFFEEHRLGAADANEVAALASMTGFEEIELLDSWRGEPFMNSVNVFLLARRP